jgi:hypothetical protein
MRFEAQWGRVLSEPGATNCTGRPKFGEGSLQRRCRNARPPSGRAHAIDLGESHDRVAHEKFSTRMAVWNASPATTRLRPSVAAISQAPGALSASPQRSEVCHAGRRLEPGCTPWCGRSGRNGGSTEAGSSGGASARVASGVSRNPFMSRTGAAALRRDPRQRTGGHRRRLGLRRGRHGRHRRRLAPLCRAARRRSGPGHPGELQSG